MSPAVLVLALSGVVRPTSMAALYAILGTREPRRLLAAYLVAGLVFSLAIGVGVVALLQGTTPPAAAREYPAVVDVVLGAAALGYAAATWTGLVPRRDPDRPCRGSWIRHRLADMSTPGAALAGVVTHLPGLVYLAALNTIVNTAASVTGGVVQVVVYNAIWFSTAIATLTLSVLRPARCNDVLARVGGWTHSHERAIIIAVFGVVGLFLLGKGAVALSG